MDKKQVYIAVTVANLLMPMHFAVLTVGNHNVK